MLKKIIPSVFMALFALSLHAQRVGLKAGVNLASFSSDAAESNIEDYKEISVLGSQAGLAFDLAPNKMFSLQPELYFIQKGSKTTFSVVGSSFETRTYLNYVEVPLLAKFKLGFDGDERRFGLNVFGGPFAGFALNGRQVSTTPLGETKYDIKFDNDDNSDLDRRLDWGLSFGAGLDLGKFFVDARYNLGINNLLDSDASNSNDNAPYLRSRGIGLAVGYWF